MNIEPKDIQTVDSEGTVLYSQTTTLAELQAQAESVDASVASWQMQLDNANKEVANIQAKLLEAQTAATAAHAVVDSATAKMPAPVPTKITEAI